MPHKKPPTKASTPPSMSEQEEEKLTMIMRQIERGSYQNMDASHITEVLSQKRQVNDYIHEENMQEHQRFKMLQINSLIQLGILLSFAILVLGLVAFVDKTYLPQALTLIIGFVGGFGVGKTFKGPNSKKD